MRRLLCFVAASVLFGSIFLFAQYAAPASPYPVPVDLASDVYRIYSSLMPVGETANAGWPHDLWLIQDTTITLVAPGKPCIPVGNPIATGSIMNPHVAVVPPDDRREDYAELMRDFDLHCHERWVLVPDQWNTKVPVHLLNSEQQREFRDFRSSQASPEDWPEFKGAPALFAFSQVYFNANHTVALVYATQWCGGLCADGRWIALQLENGHWKNLHWRSSVMVS